jgi:hypothetical protein
MTFQTYGIALNKVPLELYVLILHYLRYKLPLIDLEVKPGACYYHYLTQKGCSAGVCTNTRTHLWSNVIIPLILSPAQLSLWTRVCTVGGRESRPAEFCGTKSMSAHEQWQVIHTKVPPEELSFMTHIGQGQECTYPECPWAHECPQGLECQQNIINRCRFLARRFILLYLSSLALIPGCTAGMHGPPMSSIQHADDVDDWTIVEPFD